MTIKERTEAARGVYQDALRSHTGPMKTLRALKSAAQCFFSSRQVKKQQESNVATVSQTVTKPEEDSACTNINERNAKALDMQDELTAVLKKRAGKTQNDEDAQAEPVAPATKSTASTDDLPTPDNGARLDNQSEPAAPATKSAASTDDLPIPDNGARLDHQAAHDKNKVRPPNRRPRTRNPGGH